MHRLLTARGSHLPRDTVGATPLATSHSVTDGTVTTSVWVPNATPFGSHTVIARGASGTQTGARFHVNPRLSAPTLNTVVGDRVTLTLRGYSANATIDLRWYEGSVFQTVGTATTDANGSATATLTVPRATRGAHLVEGVGPQSLESAFGTVTVRPRLRRHLLQSSRVGEPLSLILDGFDANDTATIHWYAGSTTASGFVSVQTVPLTATGDAGDPPGLPPAGDPYTAPVVIPIPEGVTGTHLIEAVGSSGAVATSSIYVFPGMVLEPNHGPIGTNVVVRLRGYAAGCAVTVTWGSYVGAPVVATATTSALGSADPGFVVPDDGSPVDRVVVAEGAGSCGRTSQLFDLETGGGGALMSAGPEPAATANQEVTEGFTEPGPGGLPAGWRQEIGPPGAAAVQDAGRGPELVLDAASGAVLVARGGARFDPLAVQARVRIEQTGGRAGLVVGYANPGTYVAVVADEAADWVEVWAVTGGAARLVWASEPGSAPIEPGQDVWLRAEAGMDAAGESWVSVWWTDGTADWRALGATAGVTTVDGGVGVLAEGGAVRFDDFAAGRSQATAPRPEATATAEPTPPTSETEESTATPPTDLPVTATPAAPSEPPPPTEAPLPTDTPVPTDVPTPPTDTPVPPTATAAPSEPPVPTEPVPPESAVPTEAAAPADTRTT